MKEWFTGVVRGKIASATGKGKKVRETYLVDAMGFTEAENVLIKHAFPSYQEAKVISLKREIIEDVYGVDKGAWWKVIIGETILNAKGKEKTLKFNYIVSACNVGEAKEMITEKMKGAVNDWKILKLEVTPIRDVIIHQEGKPKDELR